MTEWKGLSHQVNLPAFSIDMHKVTNAEYLEFVSAGGYQERSLWSEAGWEWIAKTGIQHPKFWVPRGKGWFYRTMFADVPLPPAWPVYVSHAEAEAYARWRGKSLPTEAQFHRAAFGTPNGSERLYPWGNTGPEQQHGNFNFYRWNPTRVDAHPAGQSAFGVAGLLGNGWEWTSTKFGPFPGFEAFPFYPGYSANLFDGEHYVMKGASSRTASLLLRRSFRNWFQPFTRTSTLVSAVWGTDSRTGKTCASRTRPAEAGACKLIARKAGHLPLGTFYRGLSRFTRR
jgi:formylglycine-generating enzyme required for sulfatase activity